MHRPHPHVYEIPTVPWLVELTRRVGSRVTLGAVPDEAWDEIEALGFDYVWLMGVWHRSEEGRRIAQDLTSLHREYDRARPGWTRGDVVGSPYAIQSYEPDVLVGSWDDLRAAREALAARGMGLILDFVPNHTALDHTWVHTHPEHFLHLSEQTKGGGDDHLEVTFRGEKHLLARGRDPFFPPWTDTLQVDYYSPDARQALIGQLVQIADYCDGLRCDMAMLVENEIFAKTWGPKRAGGGRMPDEQFWESVREALPDTLLCAEAYWDTERMLVEQGFDFVYDKRLYDAIVREGAAAVRDHLVRTADIEDKLVRFIENHDEERAAAALGPRGVLPAAAVLAATLPGMRLYHHGQLDGRRVKLPVQLMEAQPERADDALRAHYERVLRVAGDHHFHEGRFEVLELRPFDGDDSWGTLVAYEWHSAAERTVCVVNLGEGGAQGRVVLDDELPDGEHVLTDALDGTRYSRDGAQMRGEGLHVILNRGQSHVFGIPH